MHFLGALYPASAASAARAHASAQLPTGTRNKSLKSDASRRELVALKKGHFHHAPSMPPLLPIERACAACTATTRRAARKPLITQPGSLPGSPPGRGRPGGPPVGQAVATSRRRSAGGRRSLTASSPRCREVEQFLNRTFLYIRLEE